VTTPNHRIRLVMELRASGVSDTAVLAAIERVPRELFVPAAFRDRAYENAALPIGHGQTLSQPSVVGLMTQALELGARMKVLEIGTGSGYQAAVLARLCRRVYTIERHKELLIEAEQRFRALKLHNVTTRVGDGWLGWPEQAPFDRIIVTAAPPELPRELLDQLRDGGFLVAPIGAEKRLQTLVRMRRSANDFAREEIAAVRFVPMVEGMPPESGAGR
jgi:protein-L-isoaspartate(D-aspartate) O-methyltransferase